MNPSLYVTGQDLEALGLHVETCTGPWDLPAITEKVLERIAHDAGVASSPRLTRAALRPDRCPACGTGRHRARPLA